jgi:hypothetical protein
MNNIFLLLLLPVLPALVEGCHYAKPICLAASTPFAVLSGGSLGAPTIRGQQRGMRTRSPISHITSCCNQRASRVVSERRQVTSRRTVLSTAIAGIAWPWLPNAIPADIGTGSVQERTKGAIQYVSTRGSDSNDGLTWATAKQTLPAAWSALPGGGDIYVLRSSFTWNGGIVPANTRIHFQGPGGAMTLSGPVVLSSGDVIACGKGGALSVNFSARPSSGAVVSAANASDVYFSCRIEGNRNENVASGVAFQNDTRVVAPLIDVRDTGQYVGNAEFGVYINGCTDCTFGTIRVRNHGSNSNRVRGTNGVLIRGSNSSLVIGTIDVYGTVCQGGNGNINVQGSGVTIHEVISTNPRGPTGNRYACDAFNMTGSNDTVDYLQAYNTNSPRSGGGTVAIEPPASEDVFGTIVDHFSNGNGLEVNSSSNGNVDHIYIGNFICRDAGMAEPPVSNRAGIELVANSPKALTEHITIGSAAVFDDLLNPDGSTRAKAATQYGIYLQQGNGGKLEDLSVGPTTIYGVGASNYHIAGAPAHYRLATSNSDTWLFKNYLSALRLEAVGTPLTGNNFSLSSGWGSGASISRVVGNDQAFYVTIDSAGVSVAPNPTVTLTFRDGAWSDGKAPIYVCGRDEANSPATGIAVDVVTLTSMRMMFVGKPIAGTSYTISCLGIGR